MGITTLNRIKIGKKRLLTLIYAMGLGVFPLSLHRARAIEPVSAAATPRLIEIAAKKFEFTPNQITIRKGVSVIFRLTSADRIHGFMSRDFKFDTDITPGKPTEVAVIAKSSGQYTVICDHYCGSGHGNMKMKVTVVD